jgi:hypothetical protein
MRGTGRARFGRMRWGEAPGIHVQRPHTVTTKLVLFRLALRLVDGAAPARGARPTSSHRDYGRGAADISAASFLAEGNAGR